jgi:hypothetical protein
LSLVAIVGRDLIIATRIGEAAVAAGHEVVRVDSPDCLPPAADVSVAFIAWDERHPDWGGALIRWASSAGSVGPRLVVFGPHTDLAAHAEARSAGIGPMMARSKLVQSLPELLG